MELLWAVLFVCTVNLSRCQVTQYNVPFTERSACLAQLQNMGREAQVAVPVGKGYQIIGSCGPKVLNTESDQAL